MAGRNMPVAARTLEDDVRLITEVLGEVLRSEEGPGTVDLVAAFQDRCRRLRTKEDPTVYREVLGLARSLSIEQAEAVVRASALLFQLLNLAEDVERIRRLRAALAGGRPPRDSLEATLRGLKDGGLDARAAGSLLASLDIELVFTAHPTEPRRRTILERLRRVQSLLFRLELEHLTPAETAEVRRALLRECAGLWQSEELRSWKPRVVDEIRMGLYYFEHVVLDLVPTFYRELSRSLEAAYGPGVPRPAPFLRFGSWRGADMDGNPSVTPETMREAARLQRTFVLRRYEASLRALIDVLTQSARYVPASPALMASLAQDRRKHPKTWREIRAVNRDEHHRAKVTFMAHRVTSALARRPGGYATHAELLADLRLLQVSLRENGAGAEADGPLEDLVRQVETFGFHLASLDLRLNARDVGVAVGQVLAAVGRAKGYGHLDEGKKARLLSELIATRFRPKELRVSGDGARVVDALRALREIQERHGEAMMPRVVLSMASRPSDVLEVLLLAKVLRIVDLKEGFGHVDLVPLFETIDALEGCGATMASLYADPSYRRHLRARGWGQEVMVGYSDSMKDGGIFASRWALYQAQRVLARASEDAGVRLTVFHGRGGSVSRGGEPAYHAVRALPPEVAHGPIRITEQGEVLTSKYFHPGIALRETEQLVSGLLAAAAGPPAEPEAAWVDSMDRMAAASLGSYRDLIAREPDLPSYFEQASPVHEIAELNLGSRPASRRGTVRIEDLRAIPWVFAWTQNRHVLPGWYGIGSALETEGDRALVRRMARDWPYLSALLDAAQMVLGKADLAIARRYADLVEDGAVRRRVFGRIADEYERTVRQILEVTGTRELLDSNPTLKASIALRDPLIDPMSYIQVALLERKRRFRSADPELLRAILLTITGISHGLRNTG